MMIKITHILLYSDNLWIVQFTHLGQDYCAHIILLANVPALSCRHLKLIQYTMSILSLLCLLSQSTVTTQLQSFVYPVCLAYLVCYDHLKLLCMPVLLIQSSILCYVYLKIPTSHLYTVGYLLFVIYSLLCPYTYMQLLCLHNLAAVPTQSPLPTIVFYAYPVLCLCMYSTYIIVPYAYLVCYDYTCYAQQYSQL